MVRIREYQENERNVTRTDWGKRILLTERKSHDYIYIKPSGERIKDGIYDTIKVLGCLEKEENGNVFYELLVKNHHRRCRRLLSGMYNIDPRDINFEK